MKERLQLTFRQRLQKNIWKRIYPIYPLLSKTVLRIHAPWYKNGRQPYHIGWLAPGRTLAECKQHLRDTWDFGNNFVAWTDSGQVLSLRKFESFDYQYHIRLFEDGEIKGHYEFTPESRPVKHFLEIGEENRSLDFKKFLGEFLVEEKHISHLMPDPALVFESQFTIDEALNLGR